MAVLLFVDHLGTKRAFQLGGEKAASDAFNRFYRLAIGGALNAPSGSILDATIESDSAAFICESTRAALHIGCKMYNAAFMARPRKPFFKQSWLRGVIVQLDPTIPLRSERTISKRFGNVRFFNYSKNLLDAIWLEKSGFKGMRLLVESSLITNTERKDFRVVREARRFPMIRRLKRSAYPNHPAVEDFLWMIEGTEAEWAIKSRVMGARFRWAASDPEELAQAASTQLVFHECETLFDSAKRGARVQSRHIRRRK